ncbi:MAG TPA: hypothetical protein VG895_00725 [Patescibacteria group bacterium]|nr:hypothetical protein [Patescibacteria group bacterium]
MLITAVLLGCVLYLVFLYKKTLDKYTNLKLNIEKNEIKRKINLDTSRITSEKLDDAIQKASLEAVELIEKNAKNIANSIKRKTVEDLIEEKRGEDKAVSAEYDIAKDEIEKYKASEFQRIRKTANDLLKSKFTDIVSSSIDDNKQDELILKALENAKRSNLF